MKRGRGQPAKGRLRLTVWIPRDLDKAIRREAVAREMTLSDVVVGVFRARASIQAAAVLDVVLPGAAYRPR